MTIELPEKKNRKFEGKHDWSGSCAPGKNLFFSNYTFSVGIFQWVTKNNGNGLKRTAVKYRIKGASHNAERIYSRAEHVCDLMDQNMLESKTKSESV